MADDLEMRSPFIRECAKREWVDESVSDVIRSLQLIADKRAPETLLPFFLHTAALRLLRCVYGSDLDTATGVRDHVMRNEQMRMEIERKLARR
jgi:hypothetical protein